MYRMDHVREFRVWKEESSKNGSLERSCLFASLPSLTGPLTRVPGPFVQENDIPRAALSVD